MFLHFGRRAAGARFIHPLDPVPRTAILAPGFLENRQVRMFPNGWDEKAARFGPISIAAPIRELRRLARLGVRIHHSAIAFTFQGHAALTDADRDLFWDAFGVPVFEQYLGAHNELLAMECDAHAGLHVVNGHGGLALERALCACGNPAPRLVRVEEF